MKGFEREDQLFSLCGLNCGLCSMQLSGYCPGCGGGPGNQSCSIARCAMEQEAVVTYCFECTKFPCKRYAEADLYDSFITHRHRMQDFARMKECGAEVYHAQQKEKIEILQKLLSEYNDGRRKTLYLLAVNLLEIEDLRYVIKILSEEKIEGIKEKAVRAATLLQERAVQRGIELKLRKKPKQKAAG